MTAGKLDSSCTRCPLVASPWLALPILLVQIFLWALLTPLPTHRFPCGSLVISIPSLYPVDFAPPYSPLLKTFSPPSSQLYHRPVISFCVDPYIYISSPGERVPLTYNPDLGPRNQGGSGGELAISQLPGPLGSSSLLLPFSRTMPALLLLLCLRACCASPSRSRHGAANEAP